MDTEDLRKIAMCVYEEKESSNAEAVEVLVREIMDRDLDKEAIRFAAHVLLHEQLRHARGRRAIARHAGTPDRTAEEAASEALCWRVGRWTESDLDAQIALNRANERGNRLAAEFYEKLKALRRQRGLAADAPSRKALSEEDFGRVYEAVYG